MTHLLLFLAAVLGGYFAHYYLRNRERVWATILLKRHLLAVLLIVAIALFFLVFQATTHSTKLL